MIEICCVFFLLNWRHCIYFLLQQLDTCIQYLCKCPAFKIRKFTKLRLNRFNIFKCSMNDRLSV